MLVRVMRTTLENPSPLLPLLESLATLGHHHSMDRASGPPLHSHSSLPHPGQQLQGPWVPPSPVSHQGQQLMTLQCHVQGCVPLLVLCVDTTTSIHQQRHQPHVALLHRQVQRGLEFAVASIDIAAALGRGCRLSPVPPPWPSCHPWGGGTCTDLLDQDLGHLLVVVQGSQMQGCEAILFLGIYQLPSPQQNLPDGSVGAQRSVWARRCCHCGPGWLPTRVPAPTHSVWPLRDA